MRKRWFSLVDVLFLVCYLPYSILPLTYSVDDPVPNAPVAGRSLSLFLDIDSRAAQPELSGIAPVMSDVDDVPSSSRVLLRKKRAIAASAKDIFPKPLARSCSLASASDESGDVVLRSHPFVSGGRLRATGYRNHHSGTSPPAILPSVQLHLPFRHSPSLPGPPFRCVSGTGFFPIIEREMLHAPAQQGAFSGTAAGCLASGAFASDSAPDLSRRAAG